MLSSNGTRSQCVFRRSKILSFRGEEEEKEEEEEEQE